MSNSQKVSFTVRRPSPESRGISPPSDASSSLSKSALPRHLTHDNGRVGSPLARSATSSPRHTADEQRHNYDSSDEDDELQDELVTGFDRFGVQRKYEKKAKEGPLVIPALKNKDWREVARKRRSKAQFVPESAKAQTGADGSVGGLGTKETINTGPVLIGLQVRKREARGIEEADGEDIVMEEVIEEEVEPETEEQRAIKALLAEANGEVPDEYSNFTIPAITEEEALKQDVDELPEAATLDDYERVPVAQFGAAMLRGMGWKEGQAASRKGKGMVEPYIPASRPALLGIGAKEQEVYDDGSKSSKYKSKRPERRYVPVVKMDSKEGSENRESSRNRSRSPKRSSNERSSRRSSRSPSRSNSKYSRDDDRRKRDRDDRDGYKSRDSGRERDRDRYADRDQERYRDRDSSRRRDYDRDDRRRR